MLACFLFSFHQSCSYDISVTFCWLKSITCIRSSFFNIILWDWQWKLSWNLPWPAFLAVPPPCLIHPPASSWVEPFAFSPLSWSSTELCFYFIFFKLFWRTSIPDLYCHLYTIDPAYICFLPLTPFRCLILTLRNLSKHLFSGWSPTIDNISIYFFLSIKQAQGSLWFLSIMQKRICVYTAASSIKSRPAFFYYFSLCLDSWNSCADPYFLSCWWLLPLLQLPIATWYFPHPLVCTNPIADINVVAYSIKLESSFCFKFFS